MPVWLSLRQMDIEVMPVWLSLKQRYTEVMLIYLSLRQMDTEILLQVLLNEAHCSFAVLVDKNDDDM